MKLTTIYLVSAFLLTLALSFFYKGLAVGFLLVYFLTAITFWILHKNKLADKNVYIIFSAVFLFHLSAVLFLYFTQFQALGGGADFDGYNQTAIEIAQRFSHGNFSLQGVPLLHYFPVLIGVIYTFTLPEMIVGQMFVVWLSCISAILLYFLSIEVGATKKSSLMTTLICAIYPSYLYFGSLLLKDTLIIPIVLTCLLVTIKIVKKFTYAKFLLFFILLTVLIHFRFYIGFAIMFSYIICWFWLSQQIIKKRIIFGLVMVVVLGFSPMILGFGYYGTKPLERFLNADIITTYREVVYAPVEKAKENVEVEPVKPVDVKPGEVKPANYKDSSCAACNKVDDAGSGSSFLIEAGLDNPFKFVKNYFVSFVSSIFGPFPWQLKYKRHIMFLSETIPLYIFAFIFLRSFIKQVKKNSLKEVFRKYKFTLPILLFAVIAMAALSLYINNFGIITRIRMPVYICLLSILALSINLDNVKILNIKTWKNI